MAIIFCFLPTLSPFIASAAIAEENNYFLVPNDGPSKIILYKKGYLEELIDADNFAIELKADKEYVFWASVNCPSGIFALTIGGPGGSSSDTETWDAEDPNSARRLKFYFTPSDSGEHTLTVGSLLNEDAGTYRIYANRAGFAGYWWMIAAGIGDILLVFLIIFGLIRLASPKKKQRRRR